MTQRWSCWRQEGGLWARNLLTAIWLWAIYWLASSFLTSVCSHRNPTNFLFLSRKGYISYFFSLDTQYPLPPLFSYCFYSFAYFSLVYSLCFYCPQNSSRASKGFLCFFHLVRMQWKAYFIQVDPTLYLEKKQSLLRSFGQRKKKKTKISGLQRQYMLIVEKVGKYR